MNWLYENLSLLHVRSSGYVEMNLKSEPTKLNGFNFQIISEGGGVDFTWFGVHTYMTGKTLSRQVYWLRKRLHVKLCKLWGLLYKSDGILVENLKGRPIWVWLKLKLTTFKWDQNLQFTPLRETMSIPSLLYGIPPPSPYHHHRGLHPELTIETPTLKLYFILTWWDLRCPHQGL